MLWISARGAEDDAEYRLDPIRSQYSTAASNNATSKRNPYQSVTWLVNVNYRLVNVNYRLVNVY